MSNEDRQLDAAEYVIGTMSAVERKAFEALLEHDAQSRADVQFWERSFGALNASISPQVVPPELWSRIDAALPAQAQSAQPDSTKARPTAAQEKAIAAPPKAANDNVLEGLMRSRHRWRLGAIAAGIAALVLGAFITNERLGLYDLPTGLSPDQQLAQDQSGQEFVAVVNANGDQPSLVVNVNTAIGTVTVRSVGMQRPQGKSLELWYVPDGQTPVSVGLVGESAIDLQNITAKNGDLLAISLEPQGGSPTGVATGPVIYTGKLVAAE